MTGRGLCFVLPLLPLRSGDISLLRRKVVTPDTPIKGSAQAAGFLREDLRSLDHIILTDESYYSFADETQNKF